MVDVDLFGRCTAPADNLDADAGHRSHVHTDALLAQYNLRILWDDYGTVGNIIVGCHWHQFGSVS